MATRSWIHTLSEHPKGQSRLEEGTLRISRTHGNEEKVRCRPRQVRVLGPPVPLGPPLPGGHVMVRDGDLEPPVQFQGGKFLISDEIQLQDFHSRYSTAPLIRRGRNAPWRQLVPTVASALS